MCNNKRVGDICMNELSNLLSRRDDLLNEISEIEEYEGIENENNAKKVHKLNIEQAQLNANKQSLNLKLNSINEKLSAINSQIDKLSGKGKERILEAIKNQRWYFFKNKTKVLMDGYTGLLWANLNYFPYGKDNNLTQYALSEIKSVVDNFDYDSIPNFRIPTCYEFWRMIEDKSFPFHYGSCWQIITNVWYWCVTYQNEVKSKDTEYNGATERISNNDSFIIPCSDAFVKNSDYEKNVSENNTNYTEKEKLQFTLDLFVENNLLPIFDDEEVTEVYKKIYFDKPKLLEQLQIIQSQIEELQKITLLSSDFDFTILLKNYDIKAIDGSIIKYYEAVQKWCYELVEKLEYYEKEKESVIRDFNIISLKLSKKYENNPSLTDKENSLLYKRQEYFKKNFSLGMNSIKTKILSVKKQADDLECRIDDIDNGNDAIHELALLEHESRASFSFIAENTAKIIKNALLKIEFFESHYDFVKNAINIWETWTEDYKVFKTTYKEELKNNCEEDGIEEEIWSVWYNDWQQSRFAIEEKVQPIIERGIKGEMPVLEETDRAIPELIISELENLKNSIDAFYKEERKGIYQKFAFESGGELQDKFETERVLYKYVAQFQSALQDIIFNCKNAEDRVFILNWASSLLDIQIDEILDFVANNDLKKIPQTILREFASLKQKNYDIYLADVKAYSEEKARREKEYNSLIFKMRKDLMQK